jgi:hypothetical protein
MKAEFWDILHNGRVESITGDVPGTISIEISLSYLRQQFPNEGSGFRVDLTHCSEFSYRENDDSPREDFYPITATSPEPVRLEYGHEPVTVNFITGTLTASFAQAHIFLDSGALVSSTALSAANQAYWNEWKARTRQD